MRVTFRRGRFSFITSLFYLIICITRHSLETSCFLHFARHFRARTPSPYYNTLSVVYLPRCIYKRNITVKWRSFHSISLHDDDHLVVSVCPYVHNNFRVTFSIVFRSCDAFIDIICTGVLVLLTRWVKYKGSIITYKISLPLRLHSISEYSSQPNLFYAFLPGSDFQQFTFKLFLLLFDFCRIIFCQKHDYYYSIHSRLFQL